jgi:hemerythrin-like domain-containing protein
MLDVTDTAAERLAQVRPVAPDTLAGLLEFFRLFADRCHHGKEEVLLFPLLEKKGLPRQGGPIGVMLHEHDQGRGLIGEMAAAAEAYAGGDAGAGTRWAGAARQYSQLLREHILKENEVLLVMAEPLLTDDEQRELAAAFDAVETERMGAETHERLHALMDKLAADIASDKPVR